MENQFRDEYFKITDIDKRKSFMKKWIDTNKEEAAPYKRVYDLRYQARGKTDIKDYFVRGWVLLCGLKNGISVKANRVTNKMMDEIKDCFGLKQYDEASDEMKDIFFKEYVNMAEFYIELAFKDRSYSSGFLGLMKMDDSRVKEKLAKEIYAISYHVPKKLSCFEEMKPVRDAMAEGFRNKFEDDYDILEKVIRDNESKK